MSFLVEETIKQELRPTEDEIASLRAFFSEIKERLSDIGKVELMGSLAKGTMLRGKREIDVFVLVEKGRDLSKVLTSIRDRLRDYKQEVGYAQHPYVRIYKGDNRADVVPAYEIREAEEVSTAVDRTQLHVEFVNKNMSQEQKDEVRLLKKFLQNIDCYGAEIRVGGLSGYLCEVLVLKFGTFKSVLEALSRYKGEVLSLGNKPSREFEDPMIFIDPTDPSRNVASPVRRETLNFVAVTSTSYLIHPKREFFFFEGEKQPKEHVLSISFKKKPIVDDVRFGVLKKVMGKVSNELERLGFSVLESRLFEENGKDIISIGLLESRVHSHSLKVGPPPWMKKDLISFLKKNNEIFISSEVLAIHDRGCSYAVDCVKKTLKKALHKYYSIEDAEISLDVYPKYVKRLTALKELIVSNITQDRR